MQAKPRKKIRVPQRETDVLLFEEIACGKWQPTTLRKVVENVVTGNDQEPSLRFVRGTRYKLRCTHGL